MEVLLTLFGVPILIGLLIGWLSGPSERDKYYHYKNKEFEKKNPDKKVNSYKDMWK